MIDVILKEHQFTLAVTRDPIYNLRGKQDCREAGLKFGYTSGIGSCLLDIEDGMLKRTEIGAIKIRVSVNSSNNDCWVSFGQKIIHVEYINDAATEKQRKTKGILD